MTDVAIVTGSAGTIGSAVSEHLTADGFKVIAADIRTGTDLTDEYAVDRLSLTRLKSDGWPP